MASNLTNVVKVCKANWHVIAGAIAIAIAFGSSKAQVSQMRADVDAIQATKPEVIRVELDQQIANSKDLRDKVDEHLSAIQHDLAKTQADVSYIRGQIDRRHQGEP